MCTCTVRIIISYYVLFPPPPFQLVNVLVRPLLLWNFNIPTFPPGIFDWGVYILVKYDASVCGLYYFQETTGSRAAVWEGAFFINDVNNEILFYPLGIRVKHKTKIKSLILLFCQFNPPFHGESLGKSLLLPAKDHFLYV